MDRFRVDGQVALVTGGTRGIGLGIVEALAEAGAHVIVSSKVPKPDVIAALKAKGYKIDYLQADMQDQAAPAKLIADATAITRRLDILVNNAGVAQHGDTHSFTEANYRRLMDINVDSVFRACQAALGPMRKQQSGVILNIGSISGLVSNIPQPQAAYNASKAAVHMLTKSLASDYVGDNIRVNAICPGFFPSKMTVGTLKALGEEALKANAPLGRLGDDEDLKGLCLLLAADAGKHITGQWIAVDGGVSIITGG
eukprot:gene39585-52206_t